MGKLQGGILGTMTGKVGGVVGSTWKDKNTLRSYRSSIAVSQTAASVQARNAFASAVGLTLKISGALARPFWQRFEKSMSGYNALLSSVRKSFTNAGVFVPTDLVISKGKMEETTFTAKVVSGGVLRIEWDTTTGGYKLNNDLPVLVVINQDGSLAKAFDNVALNATRATGGVELPLSEWVVGIDGHAYLAFRRADGSMVSNSSYATIVAA